MSKDIVNHHQVIGALIFGFSVIICKICIDCYCIFNRPLGDLENDGLDKKLNQV